MYIVVSGQWSVVSGQWSVVNVRRPSSVVRRRESGAPRAFSPSFARGVSVPARAWSGVLGLRGPWAVDRRAGGLGALLAQPDAEPSEEAAGSDAAPPTHAAVIVFSRGFSPSARVTNSTVEANLNSSPAQTFLARSEMELMPFAAASATRLRPPC